MNYTIHINDGPPVAHSRTDVAAIKRARSLAPHPPNGCFSKPEDAVGEATVRRGSVVIYRCQRVACETRRGLSTKIVVLYNVWPDGSAVEDNLPARWRAEAIERETRAANPAVVGWMERDTENMAVLVLRRCADELEAFDKDEADEPEEVQAFVGPSVRIPIGKITHSVRPGIVIEDDPSEEVLGLRALVPQAAAELQRAREAWAVERAALEASFLEAQLEIRALRGEPEGAVGEGWVYWSGRIPFWERVRPDGRYLRAYPQDYSWCAVHVADASGRAPSVREAMRAADRWKP